MTAFRGLLTLTPQRYLSAIAILLFAFILASCEEPEGLGEKIITQPGDQFNVQVSDTTSVVGHSLIEDSIRTDETNNNLLGSMVDPVFGTVNAGIFTQIRLSTNNISFGDNPELDSIVLVLQYQGEYAQNPIPKWDKLVKLNVYELTESIELDSNYYSNQDIAFDANSLGELDLLPRPRDSVMLDSQLLPPMFRIPLDQSFGQKILNGSGTVYLADNENFLKYIKGIYIKATNLNNRGSFSYINMLSSYSRVVLYYHNDEDTLNQEFVINSNCARFSRFEHYDYNDARSDLRNQIVVNGGDTSLGDQKLFIQPLGGVRTKIYFPFIKNWVDGRNIAISKAELIVNADPSEASLKNFTPPGTLALVKIREDGSSAFLTDQVSEGSDYFGGVYDSDLKQYRFNIAWHIQELLDGRSEDFGLYLAVSGNAVYGNRVILGGNDGDDRIRLVLTYVEL